MIRIVSKKTTVSLAFILAILLTAYRSNGQTNALDAYINQALATNLVIKQKSIGLERALNDIQIAKSYYLPSVAMQIGYQTGEGGRRIDLPVGDLLNPVYKTLNQLTGSSAFPTIGNVNQSFFPHNFYDAKLAVTMPIYNVGIGYNISIQGKQKELQEKDIEIYKRELVKEVKVAYFNYLSAQKAVEVYESALTLAQEAKRTNQKLLDAGKGLSAYIVRSESEIAQTEAKIVEAKQQLKNAKLYFNFLINNPDTDAINTAFTTNETYNTIVSKLLADNTVQNREELQSLNIAVQLNKTVLDLNKAYWKPQLNAFVNTGSQAEKLKFNNQSLYYIGGLQLDIPIFSGKRNELKIKQTQLDIQKIETSKKYAEQQLNLAASVSKNNLVASIENYKAAQKQVEAAATYQRIITKGFKEGVNTFLETIDARNQLVTAQVYENIQLYKVFTAYAQVERENALYPLNK